MTLQEFYEQVGGNAQKTLTRLPSEAMVRKFILKYPGDPSYQQLADALKAKDWTLAFRAAHTLKGVSQNLGFDQMYVSSQVITEALRGEKPLTDWSLWDAVQHDQKILIDAITALRQT